MVWRRLLEAEADGERFFSVAPYADPEDPESADASRAYQLFEGDRATVRLPNGTEHDGRIKMIDHGPHRFPRLELPNGTQINLLMCEIYYERARDPTRRLT